MKAENEGMERMEENTRGNEASIGGSTSARQYSENILLLFLVSLMLLGILLHVLCMEILSRFSAALFTVRSEDLRRIYMCVCVDYLMWVY